MPEEKTATKGGVIACIDGKRHQWTLENGTKCARCQRFNYEVGHPKGSEKYTENKRVAREEARAAAEAQPARGGRRAA